MQELAESEMLTELMREAKTLDMLDWPATQALHAKRDRAIADGLVSPDIKPHMLLVFIERWLKEVEPDMWRENTKHHMTVLDADQVSDEVFGTEQTSLCPGSISVPVTDDVVLQCIYDQTSVDMPTLVHFHANHEGISNYIRAGYIETLRQGIGNINVLLISYRGHCGSTGRARLFRMLRDGQKVLAHLGIDPATCVSYGTGVGSIYALELARTSPAIAGIIIEGGIANFVEFILRKATPSVLELLTQDKLKLGSIIAGHFHQVNKVADYKGCLLLMHAQNDCYISSENAEQLYESSGSSNKELRLYEEGNHNSIFQANQQDILRAMRRLFAAAFPGKIEPPIDMADDTCQVQVRKSSDG